MVTYLGKVKQHYRFTTEEIRNVIITILVATFVFAYNDGSSTFSLFFWLTNFIKVMIVVAISYFLHISVQKIVAFGPGYRVEYKLWIYGIIISLLFTILTKGKLYVLMLGGVIVYMIAAHRLGMFRYGISSTYELVIGAVGPITNVFLAFLAKMLYIATASQLFHQIMVINLVIAVYNILPIPPLDGATAFFGGGFFAFGFYFGLVIAMSLFIAFVNNVLVILFGGLIGAFVIWYLYKIVFYAISGEEGK